MPLCLVHPFKSTNIYSHWSRNFINLEEAWEVLHRKHTSISDEYNKQNKHGVYVSDIDQDNDLEFLCDNIVVDGDTEHLKGDYVTDYDSEFEGVRGVFSST